MRNLGNGKIVFLDRGGGLYLQQHHACGVHDPTHVAVAVAFNWDFLLSYAGSHERRSSWYKNNRKGNSSVRCKCLG